MQEIWNYSKKSTNTAAPRLKKKKIELLGGMQAQSQLFH
jgi:hypothetical protein